MADDKRGSLSGLTEHEAKEFHGMFVTSFIGFTGDRDDRPLLVLAECAARSAARQVHRNPDCRADCSDHRRIETCGDCGCCSIRAGR